MSKYRQYSSNTSFLDLLFNSLLAFVAFFMISLLNIKDDESKSSIEIPKAEFLVTLTWASANNDDVDIWMTDPLENLVYFSRKEDGLMHLDRDDIGNKNDEINLPDGKTFYYRENREVITLRGYIPGEYCINLHMFVKRDPGPTVATVKIEKMNPYKTILIKEMRLENTGDELTVCRFNMSKDGVVTSIKDGPKKSLIVKKGP